MKLWFIWDVKRFLIHVPLGIAIYDLSLDKSNAGLIFAMLFTVYELTEDMHISDKAYPDIQGVLGGMIIAHLIHRCKQWKNCLGQP